MSVPYLHSIGKERRTITRIYLASSSCRDPSSVCPCPEPGPKVSLSLLDLKQRYPVPACPLSTINKVYVVRRTYGVPSRPQLNACLTLIKLLYTGEPVALSLIPFYFLQQIAKHKVISVTHSLKSKKANGCVCGGLSDHNTAKKPFCFVPCCPNFSLSESSGEKLIPGKSPALFLPCDPSQGGKDGEAAVVFFFLPPRKRKTSWHFFVCPSCPLCPVSVVVGWLGGCKRWPPGYSQAGRKRGVSSVSPPPPFRCCWFGFVGGVEAGSAELAIHGQSSTIRRRLCSKKRTVHISMCPFLANYGAAPVEKKVPRAFPQLSSKCFVSVVFDFVARRRSPTFPHFLFQRWRQKKTEGKVVNKKKLLRVFPRTRSDRPQVSLSPCAWRRRRSYRRRRQKKVRVRSSFGAGEMRSWEERGLVW